MAQIEFHGVTKRFDNGQEALVNVSAEFAEGSMAFLTGHSGAGKSTFLKLLLCLDQPSRGQILVNGVNVTRMNGRRLAHYRQHLGCISEHTGGQRIAASDRNASSTTVVRYADRRPARARCSIPRGRSDARRPIAPASDRTGRLDATSRRTVPLPEDSSAAHGWRLSPGDNPVERR